MASTPGPSWWRFFVPGASNPWRRIPELAHLPAVVADEIYMVARKQARRYASSWAALALAIVLLGVTVFLMTEFRPYLGWLLIPLPTVLGCGIGSVVFAVNRQAIWRCVRVVLGMHCPNCDYDLRATADPGGPRVARRPECGDAIPPVTRKYAAPPDA